MKCHFFLIFSNFHGESICKKKYFTNSSLTENLIISSLFGYYDNEWGIVPRKDQSFYKDLGLKKMDKNNRIVECIKVNLSFFCLFQFKVKETIATSPDVCIEKYNLIICTS